MPFLLSRKPFSVTLSNFSVQAFSHLQVASYFLRSAQIHFLKLLLFFFGIHKEEHRRKIVALSLMFASLISLLDTWVAKF